MSSEQIGIWEPLCAVECALYEDCGGTDTAPCGCIHESDARYDCQRCPIVCREYRADPTAHQRSDSFQDQVSLGLSLASLTTKQPGGHDLPIFLPLRTTELPREARLPLRWCGVDARTLLTPPRRALTTDPRSFLSGREDVRNAVHVCPEAKLLAILNAKDDLLEAFWNMERRAFLSLLRHCDFAGVTGPTFSILSESHGTPAAHNVVMARRHHRVIQEVQSQSLVPIPNIYWRNQTGRGDWVGWLKANETVALIARDFSRTKARSTFEVELEGLCEIIAGVHRAMHAVVFGVSFRKAEYVIRSLDAVGSTVTFATSDPINMAIFGGRGLTSHPSGELVAGVDRKRSRPELAIDNLLVFERWLIDRALQYPSYRRGEVRDSMGNCLGLRPGAAA